MIDAIVKILTTLITNPYIRDIAISWIIFSIILTFMLKLKYKIYENRIILFIIVLVSLSIIGALYRAVGFVAFSPDTFLYDNKLNMMHSSSKYLPQYAYDPYYKFMHISLFALYPTYLFSNYHLAYTILVFMLTLGIILLTSALNKPSISIPLAAALYLFALPLDIIPQVFAAALAAGAMILLIARPRSDTLILAILLIALAVVGHPTSLIVILLLSFFINQNTLRYSIIAIIFLLIVFVGVSFGVFERIFKVLTSFIANPVAFSSQSGMMPSLPVVFRTMPFLSVPILYLASYALYGSILTAYMIYTIINKEKNYKVFILFILVLFIAAGVVMMGRYIVFPLSIALILSSIYLLQKISKYLYLFLIIIGLFLSIFNIFINVSPYHPYITYWDIASGNTYINLFTNNDITCSWRNALSPNPCWGDYRNTLSTIIPALEGKPPNYRSKNVYLIISYNIFESNMKNIIKSYNIYYSSNKFVIIKYKYS